MTNHLLSYEKLFPCLLRPEKLVSTSLTLKLIRARSMRQKQASSQSTQTEFSSLKFPAMCSNHQRRLKSTIGEISRRFKLAAPRFSFFCTWRQEAPRSISTWTRPDQSRCLTSLTCSRAFTWPGLSSTTLLRTPVVRIKIDCLQDCLPWPGQTLLLQWCQTVGQAELV